MKRALAAWDRFWFEPTSPSPICLFRIFFGLLSLLNGLSWYPDLLTWYGEHGVVAPATVEAFRGPILSLFNWLPGSDAAILGVFGVYLVSSLTLTLGLWTRTSAFLSWLAIVSLNQRNPFMFHHAGTVLRLYGFVLIFAPAGSMYSLDSWGQSGPKRCEPWAQRLLQVTLAAVYWKASCGKLAGWSWLDGTAVYYATHLYDNVRHSVPALLEQLWLYRVLTWGTILVELCLWTLIWPRRTRYPVLLAGLILHLGIEWFLYLDLLEWTVIAGYVLFLFPEDVEDLIRQAARLCRSRP